MKPLLLLHGAIGAKDQLEPIVTALSDTFDAQALNFSGHGGEPFADSFGMAQFADEVLAWLDTKQIDRIDVFGYSMGGYVALYLAKHHPDRVGRIFTLATKFEWTPAIAAREIKMLDPNVIVQRIPAFAAALEKRHAPQDWKTLLVRTADMMTSLGENNLLSLEDYAQITQPIRIAIGDKDTMVTIEEALSVYRALPNASLLVLPQTQHPVEKVNRERLVGELREFFS